MHDFKLCGEAVVSFWAYSSWLYLHTQHVNFEWSEKFPCEKTTGSFWQLVLDLPHTPSLWPKVLFGKHACSLCFIRTQWPHLCSYARKQLLLCLCTDFWYLCRQSPSYKRVKSSLYTPTVLPTPCVMLLPNLSFWMGGSPDCFISWVVNKDKCNQGLPSKASWASISMFSSQRTGISLLLCPALTHTLAE